MNANELADALDEYNSDGMPVRSVGLASVMLRQQADRIAELEKSQRFAQNFAEEQHRRACQLEEAQQSAEPVAWMMTQDGEFLDAIHPIEHEREEGTYTIPLYTTPQIKELSDEEILNTIKEFQEEQNPPYKEYENTYMDGWTDACNEIYSAIYKILNKDKNET